MFKDLLIFIIAATGGQWNVNRSSHAGAITSLRNAACPRVKWRQVSGDIKDPRVVVKSLLSAIAVMDIKVDDSNTLQPEFSQGPLSGNRHVIEQAKAHRPPGGGVVAGGSHQGKGAAYLPPHHRPGCFNQTTGSVEGSLVGIR